MRQSQLQFIRQQGFSNPDSDRHLYGALMLQPRIIAGLVLAGILAQSPWLFLALKRDPTDDRAASHTVLQLEPCSPRATVPIPA